MELTGRRRSRTKEVYGCEEGGWCKRKEYRGQGEMEEEDLLWQPLMGTAERKES